MSRTRQLLDACTATREAIESHILANEGVFKSHQALVMRDVDARNALMDAIAESGETENISNGKDKVTITPQTQTVYDEEKIRKALIGNPGLLFEVIKIQKRPSRIVISKEN